MRAGPNCTFLTKDLWPFLLGYGMHISQSKFAKTNVRKKDPAKCQEVKRCVFLLSGVFVCILSGESRWDDGVDSYLKERE